MIYNALITFTTVSAISLTDPTAGITNWPGGTAEAWRIFIQPLRGNAGAMYVGDKNVTNNGTSYAIAELAAPTTATPLDSFLVVAPKDRGMDPGEYYVHGANGQKCKATVWSM